VPARSTYEIIKPMHNYTDIRVLLRQAYSFKYCVSSLTRSLAGSRSSHSYSLHEVHLTVNGATAPTTFAVGHRTAKVPVSLA
jgi:hypothetical protein